MRTVDLKVKDVAFGGKGVGRDNGKAVFIPFTIDGERVSAKIVREKKQFAEAELVDLVEASPHRVQPPCPYFGRCGGCSYQHIDYEHQLALKFRQVQDVLRRIGKLADVPMRPIIPSPSPYGYRNRITVHAQDGVVGFFRRESHCLLDIEACLIARSEVNDALLDLRCRRVEDGHYTLRAEPGPRVFFQANNAVAGPLRDLIARLIPSGQELLVDAYCGAGFFAKTLLEKFERIIGIDWDTFAIEAARENATTKETYVAGNVDVELERLLHADAVEAVVSAARSADSRLRTRVTMAKTTLLVDPPASGLSAGARRVIVDFAPVTLIYVSCNPATLARDLKELGDKFKIESVTPLDMFPQTAEIEVVVSASCR